MDPFDDYEDLPPRRNPFGPPRLPRRPKCNALMRKGEHFGVESAMYNTSGALLGPHFRCTQCNSVWNQYANDGDFPDPSDENTK